MAKTTAPLLSFSGSGQLAKTMVYSSWKGRPYARRYVIPANPNSSAQQETRSIFSWLTNLFKFYPGSALDAWNAYADTNRFTNRNGFIKQNLSPMRGQTTIDNLIISPAARSGLIAAQMTLTAGSGQITVDLSAPDLPTGWTITSAFAAAVRQQDPTTDEFYTVVAGSDASSPYSIILTGLTAAEEYLVGGWFSYTRDDGTLAYGQSLQDTATPTA